MQSWPVALPGVKTGRITPLIKAGAQVYCCKPDTAWELTLLAILWIWDWRSYIACEKSVDSRRPLKTALAETSITALIVKTIITSIIVNPPEAPFIS